MNITIAIILGIVQGLTEFLPISSSGHLTILQHLFGMEEPSLFFNIAVHAGTLIAVLIYFRKKITRLLVSSFQRNHGTMALVGFLIISSIPAAIGGLLIETFLKDLLTSILITAFGLGLTSIFLWQLSNLNQPTNGQEPATDLPPTFSAKDALWIGVLQMLAILPGVSRSGSTILAGRWRKMTAIQAFDYSFLLSIPAIAGAFALQLFSLEETDYLNESLVAGILAMLVGLFALHFFRHLVIQNRLRGFSYYCGILALITAGIYFFAQT